MLSLITYFLAFSFGVFILAVVFLIQGPPYVKSDDESALQIIRMVKKYKGKRLLDMGSGDGKLVILLAKEGFNIDGIELNPLLVFRSRRAIKKAGVEKNARIFWGNFWSFDVSNYDVVVLYVIKHIMPRLAKKLTTELHPGSYIVSNFFVFPGFKPVERKSRAVVYEV